MFVEKLKEEVYDVIAQQRVLVLVSMDVDALCSCKILQWLFKCDNIQYTLVPISGKEDLAKAFLEHSEQIKHIFLINCGGNINLLETLEPDEDVRFYVADSHRPFDLDNIYNQDQVKILMKEGETLEVPEFDDIYADSEDEFEDEDDDEDEGSEPSSKRQKTGDGETSVRSRGKRQIWERKRQDILYRYYEFAFYGTASSVVVYELAWKMSKDSNDLLWWTAIGLTDQYINERIDSDKYVSDAESLHEHVMRHNHGTDENGVFINCMKIAFDTELRLALYRHWSLFDSICHSNYTACRFRVWTMKGKKKLHEFLADMGIPLAQSRENYSSMDVELRNNLKEWVSVSAEKFGWNTKHDAGGQHWYMVGCTHNDCYTGPGIALYRREGDYIYAPAPKWKYPTNITIPPIRGMFEGMAMGFPKEPEKYLDYNYGKNKWRTPLKCTKHYYEQCSE